MLFTSSYISFGLIIAFFFAAHPNMKLAIVHGGLMGIYELVDVGIPAIGLPIFFDQQRNIANLASKGSVIGLEFHKLNKDYFLSHIRKILADER